MKFSKILVFSLLIIVLALSSCKKDNDTDTPVEPDTPTHECTTFKWIFPDDVKCGQSGLAEYTCVECGKVKDAQVKKREHEMTSEIIPPKCEEDGYERHYCLNCDMEYSYKIAATGHKHVHYEVDREATATSYGTKHKVCDDCGAIFRSVPYAANGYSDHGKLSVKGTDLVDSKDEKFQLVGISTHGLQWASQYIEYDILDSLHNAFGINVLRLSLYTSEGGYCDCTPTVKEYLYSLVVKGVELATELDMYAIVDWHMLGAEDDSDGNPLYYKEEAKEFFARITKDLKDYDNVLYEIMNEPCGDTTWAQCKIYAEQIIPVIRENTDGIILVGNPHWSADLVSVANNPLTGFDNIMYTYHFYANGHTSYNSITRANAKGLPVFVTEHGGMEATGDGPLDLVSLKNWYKVLEDLNISYVAWNLSNTKGSASIQIHMSTDYTNFGDDNLKEWGIWYKNWVRKKFGLPTGEDE